QRLVPRLVDVDVEEARQRIAAVDGVLGSRLHVLAAFLLRQRHGAHAGRDVTEAGAARGSPRGAARLHHRSRTRLLVHARAEVALAQRLFLEVAAGTGDRVAAVQLDVAVRPGAGHAEITPAADVLRVAALAGGGEDRVHLRNAQAPDRVVLVHEHGERVDGHGDGQRLVAELLLEGLDFLVLHVAAHRTEVGGAFGQCRRRGR